MIQLSQSIILITGANKGIGKATAQLFSAKQSTILFTSRHPEEHPALEKEFVSLGAKKAKGYAFDARHLSESINLAKKIKDEFGTVDILINNAGIGVFKNVKDMSPDEWNDVINTNLTGVFYLTQQILPFMLEQRKGHIVNVGSLASRNTFPGGGAYCASKFGLLGFSECLMLDVREHDIKVSIIMPGSVNTPFNNFDVESDNETWKLTAKDVAEAIYDVVNTRSGHLMSKIELRPSNPARKKT